MKLFLRPNHATETHLHNARRCFEKLEQNCGAICSLSESDSERIFQDILHSPLKPEECDLVVAVGGDGSVLRAAQCAVKYGLPLVGINGGRLGRLCAIELSDIDSLTEGSFSELTESKRSLLGFKFNGKEHFALNDVVIAKSDFGVTVELQTSYRGEVLNSCRGDGLIISTPTGSTSYNLSAGGSVILPDVGCFAVTPICAHSPDIHPIVLSDRYPVTVSLKNAAANGACVYSDGVNLGEMYTDITIERFPAELTLLVKDRPVVGLSKEKK